ncbi:MAG: leucine-rich repeat domain-containing protein [Treponema sp.]|nr:leucine-rich repeat domain-containing protein [Treponema sp.]
MTIPNSVTAIGYEAFSRCSSLKSITIPNSVTAIGDSAFFVCRSLVNIAIPASVTAIGDEAFAGCISLTSITVDPGNRQYISVNGILFSKDGTSILCYPPGNGFTSYTIPAGVTAIGEGAFSGCSSLSSADREAIRRRFGNGVF